MDHLRFLKLVGVEGGVERRRQSISMSKPDHPKLINEHFLIVHYECRLPQSEVAEMEEYNI